VPHLHAAWRDGADDAATAAVPPVSIRDGGIDTPVTPAELPMNGWRMRPPSLQNRGIMHHGTATTASLSLLLLAACASGPVGDDSPVQVEAMVSWIERVHVEADRSRLAIADSFERLNQLAAGRFGKESAATTYARFVQATDIAEQQARRFREVVGPMQSSATPVFENWRAGLATITSDRLRQRSELRYAVSKERYDAITTVAVPAQETFDTYVKALRDHAAFLAHDLNAGAIDEIQEEVKVVANTARKLDHDMESTLQAARAYVEQSALPASSATPSR
jgi:hypothetical protein